MMLINPMTVTMSLLANFSDSNLDRLKCPYSMNTNPNQNKMTFTPEELDNILTLIDFHDDFEEVKEIWGFDIETLRNKVSDLLTNSNSNK